MERLASDHAKELRRTLHAVEMSRAAEAWHRGDIHAAKNWLKPFAEIRAGVEDPREFAWRYLWRQMETHDIARISLPGATYFVKFSPAGGVLACASSVGPDGLGRSYRLGPEGIIVTPAKTSEPTRIIPDTERVELLRLIGTDLLAGDRQGRLHHWSTNDFPAKYRVAQLAETSLYDIIPVDARRFFIRCVGRDIMLWDLHDWRPVSNCPLGDHVAVSRDGTLATVLNDTLGAGTVDLYETRAFKKLTPTCDLPDPIRHLAFGPGNRLMAAGCTDRSIRILDVQTLEVRVRLQGHKHIVSALAFSPDERALASSDEAGHLRLWDLRSGRELIQLIHHDEPFRQLEFTPSGDELRAVDARFEEFRWPAR